MVSAPLPNAYVLPAVEMAGVRLTLLNAFVVWNVPDVSAVADPSPLNTTVEVPAVNVPVRVSSVPDVPLSVSVVPPPVNVPATVMSGAVIEPVVGAVYVALVSMAMLLADT